MNNFFEQLKDLILLYEARIDSAEPMIALTIKLLKLLREILEITYNAQ